MAACTCIREDRIPSDHRVTHRGHRHAADGSCITTPDSTVACQWCGNEWRTRAGYVSRLDGVCIYDEPEAEVEGWKPPAGVLRK